MRGLARLATFYNHDSNAIFWNVLLALRGYVPLAMFWLPELRASAFAYWMLVILGVLGLIHAMYLCFEVKHLRRNDLVPCPSFSMVLLFGGLSAIGLITSVISILALQAILGGPPLLVIALLSLAAVFGATLGLENMTEFIVLIVPFLFLSKLRKIVTSRRTMIFVLVMSAVVYGITLGVYCLLSL